MSIKKRVTKDLNDSLVAFANAEGGIVIFGALDDTDENGHHIGNVVGISISDETKQQIQSRANQTHDPIKIKIEEEYDDEENGIYIVTVFEGENKPYCTGGGRYLVRSDGQNNAITPTQMEAFIKPRISIPMSPSKQLQFQEFNELKQILRDGIDVARDLMPPFRKYDTFNWFVDPTLTNCVVKLTVKDLKLYTLLKNYECTVNRIEIIWFNAYNKQKRDPMSPRGYIHGRNVDEIKKDFIAMDGRAEVEQLQADYQNIIFRVNEILDE